MLPGVQPRQLGTPPRLQDHRVVNRQALMNISYKGGQASYSLDPQFTTQATEDTWALEPTGSDTSAGEQPVREAHIAPFRTRQATGGGC